jgi:hypothetical protein
MVRTFGRMSAVHAGPGCPTVSRRRYRRLVATPPRPSRLDPSHRGRLLLPGRHRRGRRGLLCRVLLGQLDHDGAEDAEVHAHLGCAGRRRCPHDAAAPERDGAHGLVELAAQRAPGEVAKLREDPDAKRLVQIERALRALRGAPCRRPEPAERGPPLDLPGRHREPPRHASCGQAQRRRVGDDDEPVGTRARRVGHVGVEQRHATSFDWPSAGPVARQARALAPVLAEAPALAQPLGPTTSITSGSVSAPWPGVALMSSQSVTPGRAGVPATVISVPCAWNLSPATSPFADQCVPAGEGP